MAVPSRMRNLLAFLCSTSASKRNTTSDSVEEYLLWEKMSLRNLCKKADQSKRVASL